MVRYRMAVELTCNHCLSSLKLWVRIQFMTRCTRYNIKWLARRSVVFCGYSGILHQYNWSPRYSWNIVEHHAPEQNVRNYDKVVYCLWSPMILYINNMCSLNFPNSYQIIYYIVIKDKRQNRLVLRQLNIVNYKIMTNWSFMSGWWHQLISAFS